MTLKPQLELLINRLLDYQFSEKEIDPTFGRIPTEIQKLDFLSDEIKPFLTHYFADKDETGIHIYSFTVEDAVIYIAETLDFLDKESWSFDSEIYEQVSCVFENEYEAIREKITKIIGSPKYINDNYSDFKADQRSDTSLDLKRRNKPLEYLLINHMGEYRLTYWEIEQRILYLTIAHMDKEEALNIALGSRPIHNH